jgi:hypothetical protein
MTDAAEPYLGSVPPPIRDCVPIAPAPTAAGLAPPPSLVAFALLGTGTCVVAVSDARHDDAVVGLDEAALPQR